MTIDEKKVTVIARFKAKPGEEASLRRLLLALIEPTRKEDGCINYDLHESADGDPAFVFHENWTSRAALDTHLGTPHLKTFLNVVETVLAEPIDLSLSLALDWIKKLYESWGWQWRDRGGSSGYL